MPEIRSYWQANCSLLLSQLNWALQSCRRRPLFTGAYLLRLIVNPFGDYVPGFASAARRGTFFG